MKKVLEFMRKGEKCIFQNIHDVFNAMICVVCLLKIRKVNRPIFGESSDCLHGSKLR